jgi:uncharacterized protein YecA (UPF0149 family)
MGIFERVASFFTSSPDEPLSKLGRNDLCWCGSGNKYKRCHIEKDEKKRSEQRALSCRTN